MEVMSGGIDLGVRGGAIESTLLSNDRHFRELQSQLVLKNQEIDEATAELESTKRCLRFADDAVSLMPQHAQGQGTQLRMVETARVDVEAALAAAGYNIPLLSASESVLQGEIGQLARVHGRLKMKSLK